MNFKPIQVLLFYIVSAFLHIQAAENGPITKIEIVASNPVLRSEAQKYFQSQEGNVISASALSKAIRDFQQKAGIYFVRVTRVEEGNEISLRIEVKEKPIIGDIEIQGNGAISTNELLSQIPLTVGDVISSDRVGEIEARLKEYYSFRGFLKNKVKVHTVPHKTPGKVVLTVEVEEGAPCVWKGIQLSSDRPVLSKERLENLMDVVKADRCDMEQVQKGIERIHSELKKLERLASSTDDPKVGYNAEKTEAQLSIDVHPSSVIQIQFIGNTFFFERNAILARAIGVEDEKQFNQSWIEATAIDGIKTFYRSSGYPNAIAEVGESFEEKEDLRKITFRIQRGDKVRMGKINFNGNRSFKRKELSNALLAQATENVQRGAFVEDEVATASQGVLAFYQSHGYLRTTISEPEIKINPKNHYANIAFNLEEGPQSKLGSYNVRGNILFDTNAITSWMGIRPGEPIDPVQLLHAKEKIEDEYRNRGYKFVKLTAPNVDEIPAGEAVYPITVEEGQIVHFGEIKVRGNLTTNEQVIRRELKIKEGDRYNPELIRDSRRNLLRLGFFQKLSFEEINFDPETGQEDILISVDERKKRSVRFRPGFSTDDGARAAMDIGYINIAGTGRSANASGQVSRKITDADITEYRVLLTYREPQIFNLFSGRFNFIQEQSAEVQFNIEKQSYILGVDRDILSWLRGTVQWELEFRNPFDVQPGVTLSPFDEDAARFGSIATIMDLDFRNDILNPTRGSFHRIRFDLFNNYLLSEAEFIQFYIRNTIYQPIYHRFRMVAAVRLGFAATYDKTKEEGIGEIPIEKRFRLGGSDSLRGFNRNCVGGLPSGVPEDCSDSPTQEQAPGGNSVFNYMVDFLIPLFGGVDLALFTDGGNAYISNQEFDILDIRNSAGVGLRYNTFFGPLRLDLGFKLDRRTTESLTEIHFAVGQF